MIGSADLITCEVLKQAFQFLAQNPDHIEFILCGYKDISPLNKLVGPKYIKQCIDFISNNRVYITPYYEYDIKRTPSIAVVASGGEGTQFIGDYGSEAVGPIYCKPRIYTRWDATSIDVVNNTMTVAPGYNLEQKLWRNVHVVNGSETELRLDGILTRDGQDTVLYFKSSTPITAAAPLKGWSSQSDQPQKGYEISSSIDDIRLDCTLTTAGDSSLHRLLQICLRYAVMSRRGLFDAYGLQCASMTYTPFMLEDGEEPMYKSVVTITAKAPNSWISAEYPYADSAARVDIQVEIDPDPALPGDNDSFLITNFPSGPLEIIQK